MTTDTDNRAIIMRRLFIFALISLGCFLVAAVAASLILRTVDSAHVRIATVIQDVIMFITPALATAIICSRYPARFLSVDQRPGPALTAMSTIVLLASAPLQNRIIAWNQSIELPESLESVKEWMDATESSATETIKLLMGGTGWGDLIMGILIIGVLAALAEELFFRGTLQRIISRHNTAGNHTAIWITAFVFSAFHFQFYGFVPRLLLGAYFGYLVWWSRSLWLPVIVHAINNSAVVMTDWQARCSGEANLSETIGRDNIWIVLVSLCMTVAGIWIIHSMTHRRTVNQTSCGRK